VPARDEHALGVIEDEHASAQSVRDEIRDGAHIAAGQHDTGERLVNASGRFDRGVRRFQSTQRALALVVEAGVLKCYGGVVTVGGQQDDVVSDERPLLPVGGNQCAEEPATGDQRNPEHRHDALRLDRTVDALIVDDLGRGQVVARPVRSPRRGHPSGDADVGRPVHPRTEPGGQSAGRGAHS
jgi:hypothetical protein